MRVKTSELSDRALRYAVALARKEKGFHPYHNCQGREGWEVVWAEARFPDQRAWLRDWPIEQDWALAGPIIEREAIQLTPYGAASSQPKNIEYWCAAMYLETEMVEGYGPTPLIAAMRCFVASKLGEEIEIPEELI